ncbi:hypothetical protein HY989_02970 [Candidatus Micrarchaeota archaeon]|nr:hypothetical protein [Candidatus Micrarchaeota archaeon]
MEIMYSNRKIILNREWFEIDKFTIRFLKYLTEAKIRFAVISGYVAISLGRSRHTEDVDIFVEKVPFQQFKYFWDAATLEFECINAANADDAYHGYLLNNTAIRFSDKGRYIPNVEFKFAKTDLDFYSLENAIDLILNDNLIKISPVELQIAFKAFLGSEKDFEDAAYMYEILKEKLDLELIRSFMIKLKISKSAIKRIGIPI